jgi:D-alanine-D-alanine ligase
MSLAPGASRFDDRGALGRGSTPRRVAVVFGGPSPEHDVSILTGLQAARGLSSTSFGADLRSIYWTKGGEWFEVPNGLEASDYLGGVPKGASPLQLIAGAEGGFVVTRGGRFSAKQERLGIEALLVCCHGGPGEDGSLQGVLDLCGIPYSGPSLPGALLGMDKLAFSALVSGAFLQMLPRAPLDDLVPAPSFEGPYIIKPRFGGSSIGIEVVSDFESARARLKANPHLKRGAVIEPYKPELFDLQVAVRTYPELQVSAIERPLRSREGNEILGYSDKYVGSEGMTSAPHELPAQVSEEVAAQIKKMAPEVTALCGVRGVARIDFLSDGEAVYVNEINTIPGSLARHLWIDPPVPFTGLLTDLIEEAIARPAASFSSAGADGSVLRVAGSIGGKLA